MTKTLILVGDSIRMGYQDTVVRALGDEARVWAPSENGGTSANVLSHLEEWVLSRKPDVVHLNCGLHDLARGFGETRHRVEPAAYRENLEQIVTAIRARTGARLLWATTTPVHQERHHARKDFDRFEDDVDAYNTVAREVMDAHGVPVNDLYAVVMQHGRDELVGADGVHFAAEGYALLGQHVAAFVRPYLA